MKKQTHKIAIATAGALMVSVVLTFTLILPAEYSYDPLGTGAILGVLGLSTEPAWESVVAEQNVFATDSVEYVLQPYESVEYKYYLRGNSTMIFFWEATSVVSFNFHGEPEQGPEGFAESYETGKQLRASGTFTASFSGIHGWYWENRESEAVSVKLRSAGFYTHTKEFRDGFVTRKDVLR
tara:strand:- start:990 stop:1532 length:543 start_codon:yes stop_codon:yes gene_type:complete